MPNRRMRLPTDASPSTPAPSKTAQILPFSPVARAASMSECIASTRAPASPKPVKLSCAPDTYSYLNADGSVTVRTRVRTTDHSGRRIRRNIALQLDRCTSDMEIAAKVYELREKVRQGWNPRGAQITVREFFYATVLPHIDLTSRAPKTALSRFRSLIDPFLGDKKIGEITAADIRQWRDGLLTSGGV